MLDSPLPGSIDAQTLDGNALLLAASTHFGLASAGAKGTPLPPLQSADDAARLVGTAQTLALLSQAHRPHFCAAPTLQVRALHRERALDDWAPLAAPGCINTHDLPADHEQLVTAAWAPRLASLLLKQLETENNIKKFLRTTTP